MEDELLRVLHEKIEREMMKALGISSNIVFAGQDGVSNSLTSDKIRGMASEINGLDKVSETFNRVLFQELLRSRGMDPDKDMIVFSEKMAGELCINENDIPRDMRERVKIESYLPDGVFLLSTSHVGIKKLVWDLRR